MSCTGLSKGRVWGEEGQERKCGGWHGELGTKIGCGRNVGGAVMLRGDGGGGVKARNVVIDGVGDGGMQSGGGCGGEVRLKWSAERYIKKISAQVLIKKDLHKIIFFDEKKFLNLHKVLSPETLRPLKSCLLTLLSKERSEVKERKEKNTWEEKTRNTQY